MRAFILALLVSVTPAVAQQACAPHDVISGGLKAKYGETVQSRGLDGQGRLVEVYASDETGSWTITYTLPDGMTCLVASGSDFSRIVDAGEAL